MNMITDQDRLPVAREGHPEFHIRWSMEPWAATASVDALVDIGSEMQSFWAARFREDCASHHRFLHSRSPADLVEIQADFMRKAVNDYRLYTATMGKLAERLWFAKPAA
ncbi:hypothetical protein AL036_00870 [Salipiger aestuarii]|uniref:Phasin protein n=1 Tax=Salipiger aestuarii TaxID=568098 RepID=A0A327YLZ7_9RHOB|nr:hypothetical protein [Salipiger aestuarii]EIE48767.1 hypothetical protein C357_21445 [Citreicella sp. 357]KAA8610464.1 hypothetical protein AL036_00870 [Salipiger aestuarii]KAA8616480.1 hypothetical protein AL037_00865 [Salipiger aestuarii]KAB2543424.1 hypothetical protein AL035_01120 [Salipiger aestuarii]RAK22018.1 phasin protein [Salipiger aestuarii]